MFTSKEDILVLFGIIQDRLNSPKYFQLNTSNIISQYDIPKRIEIAQPTANRERRL